jgi:hypothetical protein
MFDAVVVFGAKIELPEPAPELPNREPAAAGVDDGANLMGVVEGFQV